MHRPQPARQHHHRLVAERSAGEQAPHGRPVLRQPLATDTAVARPRPGPVWAAPRAPPPTLPLRRGSVRAHVGGTDVSPSQPINAPPWAWGRGCAGALGDARRRRLRHNNTTSTRGSAARDRSARPAITPPTPSERSRPPTPITSVTPPPSGRPGSSPPGPRCRQPRCPRSPAHRVREAETHRRRRRRRPGMTSSPRSAARRSSATSSSTGTLSLKSRTCIPTDSAFCVSRVAYAPGTDTIAAFASGSASAASSSEDGLDAPRPRGWRRWRWSGLRRSRTPPREPARRLALAPATTASTRSLADARAGRILEAAVGEDLHVGRCSHHGRRPLDAVRLPHRPRRRQELHGVDVGVRAHVREPDARAHD